LDHAEPRKDDDNNKADVQDYRGGGYPGGGHGGYCRWGCCNRGYYGGCRCCSRADEIPEPMYRPEFTEVHN
jgi:hypothetical protein